jgi:hypothetical protein
VGVGAAAAAAAAAAAVAAAAVEFAYAYTAEQSYKRSGGKIRLLIYDSLLSVLIPFESCDVLGRSKCVCMYVLKGYPMAIRGKKLFVLEVSKTARFCMR